MRAWIVDRFGLGPIWDTLLDRPVPKDPWYHGDGMALLVLLAILTLTGIVLTLGYCPSLDDAYPSVQYITKQQLLGWFIRGLHYWSGGLMVVALFMHFCRQVLLGGYKSPREATWLVGVVLMFIVLTTSLLGYLLRWDERGLAGLRVVLTALRSVPHLGESLVLLIQGGPEISTLTVTRIFATHVVVVPLLLLGLVSYHVYLVVLHGTTTLAERKEPVETAEEQREIYQAQAEHPTRGEVFFPTAVAKISPWSLVVVTLALVLTITLGPRELMGPAELTGEASATEEWWFAWYSALVAFLPPKLAAVFQFVFPLTVFVGLVALPFLDRSPHRGARNRPVAVAAVILLVLAIAGLTGLRWQSRWTARASATAPEVPLGITLTVQADQGRKLFAKYGCTSCHSVSGSGDSRFGPDLAQLDSLYSQLELREYILHPPQGIAMPGYEGRLSDEELEALVAFVLVAQTFRRTQD